MGISGIIDSDGRVVKIPGASWAESVKIATVVTGDVPIDHRPSLYAQMGDWLPLACWGFVLGSLVFAGVRRQRLRALPSPEASRIA